MKCLVFLKMENLLIRKDYENSDLINLSGQEKDRLELIDNFYRIQKEILFHNLEIKSVSQTRSGNIKKFF